MVYHLKGYVEINTNGVLRECVSANIYGSIYQKMLKLQVLSQTLKYILAIFDTYIVFARVDLCYQ